VAEIEFILGNDKQSELIDFLIEKDLIFIPGLHYTKPQYKILNSREEIISVIKSDILTGPIFLRRKVHDIYDFQFGHFTKNEKNIFYIEQRMGAPCLDFLPSVIRENFDPPLIISGFISYYSSYFIDDNYTEIKAPEWIKTIYKDVNKFLGKRCKKIKVKTIKRWYLVDESLIPLIGKKYQTNVVNLDI
jgi:hypothetical protein